MEERPHESESDEMETQTEEIVEMPVPSKVKNGCQRRLNLFLNICLYGKNVSDRILKIIAC